MIITDLINDKEKNEVYLTSDNCRAINSAMLDICLYERPIFGQVFALSEVYYGLIEDNNIFKFYVSHRNNIINYKEFDNLDDALKILFESCKRVDSFTKYDEAYKYILDYFDLNNNKVLRLNK